MTEKKNQGEDAGSLGQRIESLIPDMVKRALLTGVGALFMTEEGIRNTVTELRLPKEVMNTLLKQAESNKAKLLEAISGELRNYLEKLDIDGILQKILTSLTFQITTEVRFVPTEDTVVKPQISTSIKASKSKKKKKK